MSGLEFCSPFPFVLYVGLAPQLTLQDVASFSTFLVGVRVRLDEKGSNLRRRHSVLSSLLKHAPRARVQRCVSRVIFFRTLRTSCCYLVCVYVCVCVFHFVAVIEIQCICFSSAMCLLFFSSSLRPLCRFVNVSFVLEMSLGTKAGFLGYLLKCDNQSIDDG